MNLGADDYLTKPVAKAELLNAIHCGCVARRRHRVRSSSQFRFGPALGEGAAPDAPGGGVPVDRPGKTNGDIATIPD
jgi:hypothetical protein